MCIRDRIYPTETSRSALTVFQIYEGSGEYFDLSCRPIYRESFSFGGARAAANEMDVTEECTGCGLCLPVCPQKCIDISARPVKIQQEHCLHCGKDVYKRQEIGSEIPPFEP